MKNLILVHMESLNEMTYQLNREFFPNLREIEKLSERFLNYYSSATSTYMSILDLVLGFDPSFEKCDYLENIFTGEIKSKESLFDRLVKEGYYCKTFFLNTDPGDVPRLKGLNQIICKEGDFWEGEGVENFSSSFIETVSLHADQPFAFYVIDDYSHIAYHTLGQEPDTKSVMQWFKDRYSEIDKVFGKIFDLLKLTGNNEKTVVMLYGDHGEEYWSHGLYEGYTHAIEPFTSITRCPLLLYDGGANKECINDTLISTVDLKDLLLNKLNVSNDVINTRKYAFSRNLFASQTKRAEIFHKSYSITDGEFTLMLSDEGYSMFMNRLDPGNQCNILHFFELVNENLVYSGYYDCMVSTHYKSFMTKDAINNITEEFCVLKEQLDKYVYTELRLPLSFGKSRIYHSHYDERIRLKIRYLKKSIKSLIKQLL